MALNEIQMKSFSEGSSGTDDRVDELTLPVDISHRSRFQQAQANEKDLELNLQKENIGAGPSGGSSEDDELVHPISESRSEAEVEGQGRVTTFLEPIREEESYEDDGASRTHQPVGDPETTDHTATVKECRTCGPDEEIAEPDNRLIELGCRCRGSLSMMHRKCILEWYGPRMCQGFNYKCELCNGVLHGRIELTVFRALVGQDSGADILIKAMRMAPRNARVQAPTHDGNARPDFHGVTHDPVHTIVEITQGRTVQRPYHPIGNQLAQNQLENRTYGRGSLGGGCLLVVGFFIIMALIIVVVNFASKGV